MMTEELKMASINFLSVVVKDLGKDQKLTRLMFAREYAGPF